MSSNFLSRLICLYGEPFLLVKHWTKFGPGVNGINIHKMYERCALRQSSEIWLTAHLLRKGNFRAFLYRPVWHFWCDAQMSCLLTGPAFALSAHPNPTPNFAVYLINSFTVMCLKTTQRSLHGLSETLQPQLLTCALGQESQILSWCNSAPSCWRDGASLRWGYTDWHLPCGSGAKSWVDL